VSAVSGRPRVVIVTGGSTGIGLETARRFGKAGDRIVIMARSKDALDRAIGELAESDVEAIAVAGSVSEVADVRRTVERAVEAFGSVDVVVNNAGTGIEAPILEMEEGAWDTVQSTNLKGAFLMTREAAPQMMSEGGGGVLLFTSSINAVMPVPPAVAYSTTKAALDILVRGLAVELGPHGIRACGVSPGYIETPSLSKVHGDPSDPAVLERWVAQRAARVPLGRLGGPEEIAAAFFFLASADAAYITGTTLTVDGGRVAAA
jgi:glucose 1-dehydrogenase